MNSWIDELKEYGFAVTRIILGIIVLIGVLVFLDIVFYLSITSSTFAEKVEAAFHDGYSQGYAQTYEAGFQEAHSDAYDKGYDKGYEIGMNGDIGEKVAARVKLRNPTIEELREFLAQDKTDTNEYVRGEYVCYDFAVELNNNAEANGIRAAYVYIRSTKWGHGLVGFETVDEGLVFIDPQSDRTVRLVVGESYPWYGVGAVSPSKYLDEPIIEVQIIW